MEPSSVLCPILLPPVVHINILRHLCDYISACGMREIQMKVKVLYSGLEDTQILQISHIQLA
jgi:hypothetical protein